MQKGPYLTAQQTDTLKKI